MTLAEIELALAGLTNQPLVWDFQASTPLKKGSLFEGTWVIECWMWIQLVSPASGRKN